MSSGPWIPIPKAIASKLPKGQAYTFAEAFLSVAIDCDNKVSVTVKGYADLWGWSRGKVERFLDCIGAMIQYPEDTRQKQNQNGQIMIQMTGRTRADNNQIKLIDLGILENEVDRWEADVGQKTGRSQGTTINTNTKTKSKGKNRSAVKEPSSGFVLLRAWWLYAFEQKEGCQYPFQTKDGVALSSMLESVNGSWKEIVCRMCHYLDDPNRFPSDKAPSLTLLKSSLAGYPGHINGKLERFRQLKFIPPEGIQLEDWRPWEKHEENC